jgi:hypothetical protein
MIYDLVYPMLIALIVDFHVVSLPIFNSLAYPQLKRLKKLSLSTAVLYGVARGGFLSVMNHYRYWFVV